MRVGIGLLSLFDVDFFSPESTFNRHTCNQHRKFVRMNAGLSLAVHFDKVKPAITSKDWTCTTTLFYSQAGMIKKLLLMDMSLFREGSHSLERVSDRKTQQRRPGDILFKC